MDDDQQFCLRWNNHQSTLISVFDTLLENGTLVDCTLAAEGKFLKAHKVVLSACSPYFAALLSQQYDKHPIFILKDIKFQELRAMMDYMYRGEVNISQDQLAALLKAAESLQIKGLSESRGGSTQKNENVVQKQPVPVVSKSGLTIEHKRPANKHPTSAATESDVSMSREGSTSPTSRKRKKFRRRSIEVNNMDNHDQLSNSSSQSQSIHMTSIPMTAASQITSATSAANVLNVTKKTDHHDSKKDMEQSQADDDEDDDKNDLEPPAQRQKHDMDVSHIKEKMQSTHSELLIEPKNEYDDGQDETVEDLTLDDEELLEDLDQAGPSHGGEGSSQGYAQWQVGQNQDEVFLAAQEAAGQHRDAQGKTIIPQSVPHVTLSKPTSITTIAKKDLPLGTQKIMIPVSFSNIGTLSSICSSATSAINPSYQILIATKTHPRIKYSGMKKIDEGSIDASDIALSTPTKMNNNIGMSCVLTPFTTMSSSSTTLTTLTTAPMTTHLQTPITLPIATPIKLPLASIPMQTTITLPLSTTITQKLTPIPQQQTETNQNELSSTMSQTVTVVPTSTSSNDLAVKYADIDDIELPDGTKIGYPTDLEIKRLQDSDISTLAEKYSLLAANAIKNFDLSSINDPVMNQSGSDEPNELYACRHCGKRYRWKSTLRRHESVECNGKEPTYKCPYCEYKAKQRGNLGVHVRKHHSEKPQLESRRKKRASTGNDDVSG